MLGEIIAEISGQVTGTRVLEADGPGPKIEASIQGAGKLLESEATMMATYRQTFRGGGCSVRDASS